MSGDLQAFIIQESRGSKTIDFMDILTHMIISPMLQRGRGREEGIEKRRRERGREGEGKRDLIKNKIFFQKS